MYKKRGPSSSHQGCMRIKVLQGIRRSPWGSGRVAVGVGLGVGLGLGPGPSQFAVLKNTTTGTYAEPPSALLGLVALSPRCIGW